MIKKFSLKILQSRAHHYQDHIRAVFTYSGRFSTRGKASDGAAGDEAMALAIADESDAADGVFVAGRKLIEYVNTAHIRLSMQTRG